eukprot:GHVO01040414.1.p1 GENE.GHVO01040414.1~~GHVO01040414.1.p1  ORF type:complete len:245 (+),score=28.89 GHVO01040414.1:602-1336(+)
MDEERVRALATAAYHCKARLEWCKDARRTVDLRHTDFHTELNIDMILIEKALIDLNALMFKIPEMQSNGAFSFDHFSRSQSLSNRSSGYLLCQDDPTDGIEDWCTVPPQPPERRQGGYQEERQLPIHAMDRLHVYIYIKLMIVMMVVDTPIPAVAIVVICAVLDFSGVFEVVRTHARRLAPRRTLGETLQDVRDRSGGGEGAPEQDAVRRPPADPGFVQRFLYQLAVMFVGTLMPWWRPDVRYL